MRFAILGAGFAGLAAAWHLLNYTQGTSTVDLFDPNPIGGGASGISSGLLHPFAGKHAKMSWEAEKSIRETHRLITVSSQAIGSPVILSKGILRPALSEQQVTDFKKCAAEQGKKVEWWDSKKCESTIDGLKLPDHGGGLFISEGLTLDSQSYLRGLWQACALLGTQFHQQTMIRKSDLDPYDKILVAMGPMSKNFPHLKELPISPVKGQMLELQWPPGVKPPPFSLVSQKYLVMAPDLSSCLVGATYEHQFTSPQPDVALATAEIMPQIVAFFPALKGAPVIRTRAAFRATTPNHLPIVGRASDSTYFFTGLGSKGLLYHAWIGKRIARAMLTGDEKHFPPELLHRLPQG